MSARPYRDVALSMRLKQTPRDLAVARAALGQGMRAALVVLASGLLFLLLIEPLGVVPLLLIGLGLVAFGYERWLKRRALAALSPVGPGETSVTFLSAGLRFERPGMTREVGYAELEPYRRAAGALVLRGADFVLVLPIRSLDSEQLIGLERVLEGRLREEDPRRQWLATLLAVGVVSFLFLWWMKS